MRIRVTVTSSIYRHYGDVIDQRIIFLSDATVFVACIQLLMITAAIQKTSLLSHVNPTPLTCRCSQTLPCESWIQASAVSYKLYLRIITLSSPQRAAFEERTLFTAYKQGCSQDFGLGGLFRLKCEPNFFEANKQIPAAAGSFLDTNLAKI